MHQGQSTRTAAWTIVLGLLATVPCASADEPPEGSTLVAASSGGFVGSAEVAFYNSYYFRGVNVFDDTFNVQPNLTLGWAFGDLATISLGTWAAIPFHNRDALASVRDEVDLTLDATFTPVEGLSVSVGTIIYLVPSDPLFHTEEVYATVGYELGLGFSVSAGVYGDVNEFQGIYFKVAPAWGIDITESLAFSLEVFVGGAKYKDAEFAMTETGVSAGFEADLGSGLSTGLSGLYNFNVDASEHVYALAWKTGYSW